VLITELGSSIGVVYALFAGYAMVACRDLMRPDVSRVVWFLVGINALMLTMFVVTLGFLTKRYPVTLTLLILLLASFGALALYRRLDRAFVGTRRRTLIRSSFVLVALYFFVDGVYSFSPGKSHVAEAADWLVKHAAPSDRVFSLDAPLLYRAKQLDQARYHELQALMLRTGDTALRKAPSLAAALSSIDWREFDYIVALVKRKRPEQQQDIERLLDRPPLKEFRNSKGDRALIYATHAGP